MRGRTYFKENPLGRPIDTPPPRSYHPSTEQGSPSFG